jgi:hypothetical protein
MNKGLHEVLAKLPILIIIRAMRCVELGCTF